ncbi:MAG: DUF2806 domain-containing protein [Oscillospiraceae bacterium]|nr:DUF2806 domain-containing protein [Oscillospiraceae bacterium]
MGELLDAAKVMVQPTIKLLDMIQSGVGTLYNPINMKRTADAKVYEIEKIGQALRDNSDIPIGYSNGAITMDTQDFREFVERTQSRLAYQEMTKQANIEKVSGRAYQLLEGEEDVENNPVEQDWTMRFFNCVEDVSNEKMQEIWSKILAGEVKKPGSFSMRTLETLKNISQKEAEVFQKVFPFIMSYGGECFISSDDDLLNQFDIFFADLMILGECGLVNTSLSNNPKVSKSENSFMYSDKVIVHFWGYTQEEKEISIGVHLLTRAGKELYSILEHTGNKEYAVKWAEKIFNQNKNSVKVLVHNILNINKNTINHEEKPFAIFSKDIEVIQ